MKKSGLADSPFFTAPPKPAILEATPPSNEIHVKNEMGKNSSHSAKAQATKQPRHHDTMVSSNRDTTVSLFHDTSIEIVRKAVRELGKEAATHRFTPEEKKALLDIIYSYKGSGIKTSENEVARIAINFIIEDYRRNGENSILDRVLKALNE
jgi:hypothetical protein